MRSWPNKLRKARIILERPCKTHRPIFERPATSISGIHHRQIGIDVRADRLGYSVNMERPDTLGGTAIWKNDS